MTCTSSGGAKVTAEVSSAIVFSSEAKALDGILMGEFPARRCHDLVRTVLVKKDYCCSQVVPYVGDNQDYSQTLTGLQQGHTYSVHIQVSLRALCIEEFYTG